MNLFKFKDRFVKLYTVDKDDTIWKSDTLLLHVQRGLGRLKTQSYSDGEKVTFSLVLNDKSLMSFRSENYYCPTCEKLLKRGYGLQNINDAIIEKVRISQQAEFEINKAAELASPILSLLENGLYMISKIPMYPTDGEGNFFWTSCNEERYFKATTDIYYNLHYGNGWPNFLYPTQPFDRLDMNRVTYYRDQIKTGVPMTGLAYYMDGFISALLDGHHRAAAACLEGTEIDCLTIMKVSGYQQEKGEITHLWGGGNAIKIDKLPNPDQIKKLLVLYNKQKKHRKNTHPKDTDNKVLFLKNVQSEDLLKELNRRSKEYPQVLSVAFKSMINDASLERLDAIWDKTDQESEFDFDIIIRILFTESPMETYPVLKRIVSDHSKHQFWELAFQYLATFNNEEVEDIFINYLVNSEFDKHDQIRKIANDYLKNRQ